MWIRRILEKFRILQRSQTTPKPEVAVLQTTPVDKQLRKQPVTIGLDFGTCSTKCVLNLENIDERRDKYLAVSFASDSVPEGTLCIS
ncbi:MAG: hypothetical protein QGH60_22985, partial [Phycisphaerae bacterium]|nr:hypothetical protein [Phycisphaerae bacterium]